jgi:hypothetical protein
MNLQAHFQQFADAAATDAGVRDQFAAWSRARREWCSHWTGRGATPERAFQLFVPAPRGAQAGQWLHPIAEEAPEFEQWRSRLDGAPAGGSHLAEAFVRAVERIERDRSSLAEACEALGRLTGRNGFPLAALTPALSAIDPNRFVAVCDAWLRPLADYEGMPLTPDIARYDHITAVALRWLAAAEGGAPPAIGSYPAAERFGVFCSWLARRPAAAQGARFDVTKKKYKDWPPMW